MELSHILCRHGIFLANNRGNVIVGKYDNYETTGQFLER